MIPRVEVLEVRAGSLGRLCELGNGTLGEYNPHRMGNGRVGGVTALQLPMDAFHVLSWLSSG